MPPMTIDTGNTAFMLLCSSLVMLMTPGLAFFYGGLVGRKNVLAIMIQSFVSMGWTTVLWWAFGFSLCFSGDLKSGTDFFGILGNFHWAFLRGITLDTPSLINPSIPMIVFCAYQMMFADRKSTRLNSSHLVISYAVFCLKKKKKKNNKYK